MNNVLMSGRLARDPQFQAVKSGNMARFTLAVERPQRRTQNGQPQTQNPNMPTADFISCVAFGHQADLMQGLHKGSRLMVVGRIQTGSYTNRDGQKVYTTDVLASAVEPLMETAHAASPAQAAAPAVQNPAPVPAPTAPAAAASAPAAGGGYYVAEGLGTPAQVPASEPVQDPVASEIPGLDEELPFV